MIYVVTNRKLIDKANDNLFNVVTRALLGGANGIILREKDLSEEELLKIAIEIKKVTDRFNVPLIINGNIQVAKKIKAYGCQLSYEKFISIFQYEENIIKEIKDFNIKLGVSIHKEKEAINAQKLGANYVIAGHIFQTECKKGLKGKGIDFIKNICLKISIPVIGIGGVDFRNVKSVINAGAKGVAIMSSGMCKNNLEIISNLKNNL